MIDKARFSFLVEYDDDRLEGVTVHSAAGIHFQVAVLSLFAYNTDDINPRNYVNFMHKAESIVKKLKDVPLFAGLELDAERTLIEDGDLFSLNPNPLSKFPPIAIIFEKTGRIRIVFCTAGFLSFTDNMGISVSNSMDIDYSDVEGIFTYLYRVNMQIEDRPPLGVYSNLDGDWMMDGIYQDDIINALNNRCITIVQE